MIVITDATEPNNAPPPPPGPGVVGDYASDLTLADTVSGKADLKLVNNSIDASGALKAKALVGQNVQKLIEESLTKSGYTEITAVSKVGTVYTYTAKASGSTLTETITCDSKADNSGDITWYMVAELVDTDTLIATTATTDDLFDDITNFDGSAKYILVYDDEGEFVQAVADSDDVALEAGYSYTNVDYFKVDGDFASAAAGKYNATTAEYSWTVDFDNTAVEDTTNSCFYVKATTVMTVEVTVETVGDDDAANGGASAETDEITLDTGTYTDLTAGSSASIEIDWGDASAPAVNDVAGSLTATVGDDVTLGGNDLITVSTTT